jgi:hypothetical protein
MQEILMRGLFCLIILFNFTFFNSRLALEAERSRNSKLAERLRQLETAKTNHPTIFNTDEHKVFGFFV